MSKSPSAPPASAKTDLETVVNWPLFISAAALAIGALAVPLVLACIAAGKGGAVKDQGAVRSAIPGPRPVKAPTAAEPVRPAPRVTLSEIPTPLQVYVEGNRPRRKSSPAPVAVADPPRPQRALNPILQAPGLPEPPAFKYLDHLSEDLLLRELLKSSKEVDLESVKGTREKLLAHARDAAKDGEKPSAILTLFAERADLKGLPVIGVSACQARPEAAKKMQEISRKLRQVLDGGRRSRSNYPDLGREPLLGHHKDWLEEDGLSTVVQMLQAGDLETRHELVERLATVKTARATTFLARAALFDLAPEVRRQAVITLKDRPRREYEKALLDGLHYPWAPVAAHAAEALVALDDREALPQLAALLEEPDPRAPRLSRAKKWVVSEVVRVNHLRNCLLCHAPSTTLTDPLRGVVPTPGQPLPRVYYARGRGDFVRADITYLRQDFSLMEYVAKPDKWPKWQRFDYVVRSRELTPEELTAWKDKARKAASSSYPQRQAVLFALRELTGQDVGDKSSDWYDLLYTRELSGEQ